MASLLAERGIGLELYQYRVAEVLVTNINDELDRQQALWADRDTEWNNLTGQEPSYVELEYVESKNIFRGHRPSLIEKPPMEKFPNISVMAYVARPASPTNILDQATNNNIVVDLETAIKATSEAQADARMHRTVEAIHQVLEANKGLGGLSQGWESEPIVNITDIYKRPEKGSYGDMWFWQMARLRYTVIKHSSQPEINIDQI